MWFIINEVRRNKKSDLFASSQLTKSIGNRPTTSRNFVREWIVLNEICCVNTAEIPRGVYTRTAYDRGWDDNVLTVQQSGNMVLAVVL